MGWPNRQRVRAAALVFNSSLTVVGLKCRTRARGTHATATLGHLREVLFDFRPAALMTVCDKQHLIGTARMRPAVPLFPLDCESMLHYIGVLTRGTTHLEEGHVHRRHSG